MQQIVNFSLGGVDRSVKADIDLAMKIESALGKGLLDVGRALMDGRAPIVDALTVLRLALLASGKKYTDRDMIKMAEHDGIRYVTDTAAMIVSEFFRTPDSADGGDEGNG